MRVLLVVAAILGSLATPLSSGEDQPLSCHAVAGELSVWNGWPPALRIESSDGVVYGVPETDEAAPPIPDDLLALLLEVKAPLAGTFTVCPLGTTTSVPYDKRPIVYVSILDYDLASE